ncbi:hypothetical protein ACJ72_08744 [Emergomyces africanus]|uniref:C6 transcription factor n=1 Tax=Emergomyces africanus TaxID=1955775 RepID=A0A1B7NJR8_9EURO|nr:hypothetical protein ACJ72_08744 [Emergomyces africanus]
MEVDHQLRQARDMIPKRMAVKPPAECNEPVQYTKSRYVIESIYHKAQCVLHRRFLHRGRENPRYAYSRRACIDSAMELLRFQKMLQTATNAGSVFANTKGYINTTSTHDFLMAGTILALDIYQMIQEKASGRPSADLFALGMDRYQEELEVLCKSRDLWNEVKDQSVDAWRATAIMDVMLGKLFPSQSQQEQNGSNTVPTTGPSAVPTTEALFVPQDEKQNAAMTLGLLSTGLSHIGSTSSPPITDTEPMMKFEAACAFGGGMNQGGMIDPTQLPSPGGTGLGMGVGVSGHMPTMQPFNLDWVCVFDPFIDSFTH